MNKYKSLIIVSTAASLLMVGVGMIVALLPQRVLSLSGSVQDVGHVASIFAIAYLAVQLPIGGLADRFGARPFLVTGYLVCCLSGLIFFFAATPETIFLGRFVQGIGEAPIWALGPALLCLAYPHAKGKMIGIYNAAIHAGLAIGPMLGLALFSASLSPMPFLLFAGLCFCGVLLVAAFLPKAPQSSAAVSGTPEIRDLLKLLCARRPLSALSGILLYGAGYGIFISVLPASLAQSKGFDGLDNGIFFTLFYVAISVSQLIFGPLSDRHGRQGFMSAGLVMAAAGIVGFLFLEAPLIYLPLTFASLGLGIFCVSSIAYLNECVSDALKATISGGYYLAWGLGYFLGPLLIGWCDTAGYPQVGYLVLSGLMLLQALLHYRFGAGST